MAVGALLATGVLFRKLLRTDPGDQSVECRIFDAMANVVAIADNRPPVPAVPPPLWLMHEP